MQQCCHPANVEFWGIYYHINLLYCLFISSQWPLYCPLCSNPYIALFTDLNTLYIYLYGGHLIKKQNKISICPLLISHSCDLYAMRRCISMSTFVVYKLIHGYVLAKCFFFFILFIYICTYRHAYMKVYTKTTQMLFTPNVTNFNYLPALFLT